MSEMPAVVCSRPNHNSDGWTDETSTGHSPHRSVDGRRRRTEKYRNSMVDLLQDRRLCLGGLEDAQGRIIMGVIQERARGKPEEGDKLIHVTGCDEHVEHRHQIDDRSQPAGLQRFAESGRETFRVVGIWNEETERYHLYITNLPADRYSAADIGKIYQARWEVELLFRELKRVYGLDKIPSSNPEVVEALILIGLLSLVVSRTLRELFIEIFEAQQPADCDEEIEPSSVFPRERFARAVSRWSDRILQRVAQHLGYESPSLVKSMWNDAINPNAYRTSLLEDVQHGAFGADLA